MMKKRRLIAVNVYGKASVTLKWEKVVGFCLYAELPCFKEMYQVNYSIHLRRAGEPVNQNI